MKHYFAIWILVILSCSACGSTQQHPSAAEKAADNAVDAIEEILSKKYHMKAIGVTFSMPRGIIKKLGIDFNIRGPLSKEQLRAILINMTQDFVNYVNVDQKIQLHLEHRPFTFKNVEITLFLISSGDHEIEHPNIGIAEISKGELTYITVININEMPHYETEEYESYEEALKIVQERSSKKDSVTTTIPNT
jgi:hypothetical protein